MNINNSTLEFFFSYSFDEELPIDTLKIDDFAKKFTENLHMKFSDSEKTFMTNLAKDINFKPFGKESIRFSRNDRVFLINHIVHPNQDEKQYLKQFQYLNHFFIEDSSNIDMEDENWEFFVL